jgi:uncharacterized membrane protein YfcA
MSITSPGILFVVSIVAGFIGAMSGMGGGIVLIPALTLFGVGIKHAIAISIVSVIATSSGAASAYVRDGVTNLKIGMFLEMFTILGAIVGATVTLVSSDQPLFIAFGAVLLLSWGTLFVRKVRHEDYLRPSDPITHWLELRGGYYDHAENRQIDYEGQRGWLGGPCMFGAGFIAGLLGIGAGALKVLILDLAMGLPPKVSTTTSNLIIGVTALAGTSIYIAAGYVDPGLAAPVIIGVVAGAFLGTRLLKRLSNHSIRKFFLVVLLLLGIEMILRGLGVFGHGV